MGSEMCIRDRSSEEEEDEVAPVRGENEGIGDDGEIRTTVGDGDHQSMLPEESPDPDGLDASIDAVDTSAPDVAHAEDINGNCHATIAGSMGRGPLPESWAPVDQVPNIDDASFLPRCDAAREHGSESESVSTRSCAASLLLYELRRARERAQRMRESDAEGHE